MAEKTTVSFRIDESVKHEWDEAAKDPEYGSLSHLIRLSVQREIAADEGVQTETSLPDDGEVLGYLNRLERDVGEIQDEVEAIGRESRSEALYDMKQVLLEILPTAEGYVPGNPDDPEPETVGQKPREVAARIGADTSEVDDALAELDEEVGQIQSSAGYYWRNK